MHNLFKMINNSKVTVYLTICGSARFRETKEKYQAYYTILNNMVFMPVNYSSIQDDVHTLVEYGFYGEDKYIENLHKIHDTKISMSKAIIVVNPYDYIGEDTQREIIFARNKGKNILYTHIPEECRSKYLFNNDENYPLYMLKED